MISLLCPEQTPSPSQAGSPALIVLVFQSPKWHLPGTREVTPQSISVLFGDLGSWRNRVRLWVPQAGRCSGAPPGLGMGWIWVCVGCGPQVLRSWVPLARSCGMCRWLWAAVQTLLSPRSRAQGESGLKLSLSSVSKAPEALLCPSRLQALTTGPWMVSLSRRSNASRVTPCTEDGPYPPFLLTSKDVMWHSQTFFLEIRSRWNF